MKRYLSLILVVAIALLMLTACQQDGNENNQDQPDEIERTQDSSVEILQADKILIERAVDLLVDQWKAIAWEDDCNNGHLEIKNTRILHINSDEIAEALGVEGVESIVEFVIFTDYFGAAPYYYETQRMNNVVFFSDGTSAVITNAVQMYAGKTYNASLKNCSFTVFDCKTAFNQIFNLKEEIDNKDISNEQAKEIAQSLVSAYHQFSVLGVCCDVEYSDTDMSSYLSSSQKDNYWNMQYRLKCCHSVTEVRKHILETMHPNLAVKFSDENLFVDNDDNVYVFVTPMGVAGYGEISVIEYSESRIIAEAPLRDVDGDLGASDIFTIEKAGSRYVIVKVTQK